MKAKNCTKIAALIAALGASYAGAANFGWVGASGAAWGDSSSWTPAGFPNAPSDVANFPAASGTATVSVANQAFTVGQITASRAVTFNASNNGSLVFNNGASRGVLSIQTAGNMIMNPSFNMTNGLDVTIGASRT